MESRATRLASRLVAVAMAAALAACAATQDYLDPAPGVAAKAKEMSTGPANAPVQNMTSFATSLRCMDLLFVTYGMRDVTVLLEDIPDATKKVSASTKDMIISAVSQMTRRSRAVRLVAFSAHDVTTTVITGIHTKNRPLENTPRYIIRGSVSQYDESMVRRQGEAGITIGRFGVGDARQATASLLGLDLNVIYLEELELVPGVTSKNSVLIMREGAGTDAELSLNKFGVNFNFTLARSEGSAQALRTLAELATIELFGRLLKIPYWSCLNVDANDPQVASEIVDWWETLAANPVLLVAYFQQQMKARGLYPGEATGDVDDSLLHAIKIYQRAIGESESTTLDFDFFRRYLSVDHAATGKKALAMFKEDPGPPFQPPVAQANAGGDNGAGGQVASVQVVGLKGPTYVYARGEPYQVDVAVDQDANLYCYLLDENQKVNQFFPNPIQPNPAVRGGTRMNFPGNFPFRLIANTRGVPEAIACFAVPTQLEPERLNGLSNVRTTSELVAAFKRAAGAQTAMGIYDVKIR
jgi:negative regulator of replication initiation